MSSEQLLGMLDKAKLNAEVNCILGNLIVLECCVEDGEDSNTGIDPPGSPESGITRSLVGSPSGFCQ